MCPSGATLCPSEWGAKRQAGDGPYCSGNGVSPAHSRRRNTCAHARTSACTRTRRAVREMPSLGVGPSTEHVCMCALRDAGGVITGGRDLQRAARKIMKSFIKEHTLSIVPFWCVHVCARTDKNTTMRGGLHHHSQVQTKVAKTWLTRRGSSHSCRCLRWTRAQPQPYVHM